MPKVLLVDDDFTMVDLLQTLLEMEQIDVHILSGNEPILKVLQEVIPDVVLIDVFLNDYRDENNGFDVLSQIRDRDGLDDVKVIMSSGMDFREKSIDLGADEFIQKPYMPEELIKLIKRLSK